MAMAEEKVVLNNEQLTAKLLDLEKRISALEKAVVK